MIDKDLEEVKEVVETLTEIPFKHLTDCDRLRVKFFLRLHQAVKEGTAGTPSADPADSSAETRLLKRYLLTGPTGYNPKGYKDIH
ncbi:hypothetical protein [Pseudohalioglobus lutimaris]|nr:hypothetical protein [Pseudohalioglobus lutimaris]